jgi:nitrous oxide reductase accessory protein NosL
VLKTVFILLCAVGLLYAQNASPEKIKKLAQKGERIVKVMCDKDKLPQSPEEIEALMDAIFSSEACSKLSKAKLEAIAYYIQQGSTISNMKHIHVNQDDKCPVCGMFVAKYPKWVAMMKVSDKTYYFDGVKDMMKYYIFDGDFIYNRKEISQLLVSDYYTLKAISAKEAFYVVDSDVYGPMGHELIPFETEAKAKIFASEHHGKAVVKFYEITDTMVMTLDGIEY